MSEERQGRAGFLKAEGAIQAAVWFWLDDKLARDYEASELEALILLDVVQALRDYESRAGIRIVHRPGLMSAQREEDNTRSKRPASSAVD